jgi:hypothetical protein
MKIFLCDKGDYSVGIPCGLITIDMSNYDGDDAYYEEYRQSIKETLLKTFTETFDPVGGFSIWFEDECVECGKKLNVKNQCTNKHCIVNIEETLP